jgi:hypothetical protein
MKSWSSFVATWILVSWEAHTPEGDTVHPFGEDAAGRIMYDGEGNMSVHLMHRDRPHFSIGSPLGGTAEEIEAAYNGYLAYYGTYKIQENACPSHIAWRELHSSIGWEASNYVTSSSRGTG